MPWLVRWLVRARRLLRLLLVPLHRLSRHGQPQLRAHHRRRRECHVAVPRDPNPRFLLLQPPLQVAAELCKLLTAVRWNLSQAIAAVGMRYGGVDLNIGAIVGTQGVSVCTGAECEGSAFSFSICNGDSCIGYWAV